VTLVGNCPTICRLGLYVYSIRPIIRIPLTVLLVLIGSVFARLGTINGIRGRVRRSLLCFAVGLIFMTGASFGLYASIYGHLGIRM
jgi:hypothetical protein